MMQAFAALLAFPVVVWTVMLGVLLVYWLFVMTGLVHLGEGADGAVDGVLDGTMEGAGHVDAVHQGADVGGDADIDLDVDADGSHGIAAFLSALRLRSVPLTVSVSLIVFYAWALSLLGVVLPHAAGLALPAWVAYVVAFFVAPLLALPLTSMTVRPLAPLFTPRRAKTNKDMIGRSCVVRTGSVTATFGEAIVKDTGSDLILRVRVDGTELKRGEEALIVGFDEEREEYIVESMDPALMEKKLPR